MSGFSAGPCTASVFDSNLEFFAFDKGYCHLCLLSSSWPSQHNEQGEKHDWGKQVRQKPNQSHFASEQIQV